MERIQAALKDKENTLKDNIKRIAELDEAIILIDDRLEELQLSRLKIMTATEERIGENNLVTSLNSVTSVTGIERSTNVPTNISTFPNKTCQKPQEHSTLCAIRIIRQNIAAQKAQIMKNLELNNYNKDELDKDIAKLQHMQKQYIGYEKETVYNEETPNHTDFCFSSDEGDVSSQDFLHNNKNSNSGESRDDGERSKNNIMNVRGHGTSYRSDSPISQNQLNSNGKPIE